MNYSKASLIIILLFVVAVMNSGIAAFPVVHAIFLVDCLSVYPVEKYTYLQYFSNVNVCAS